MLNYTNANLCDTQDGESCFGYSSGWYLTYDSIYKQLMKWIELIVTQTMELPVNKVIVF